MMPGDNKPSVLPIAADATVGACQNCSVLHQNLNEYVSSFLALKQKIVVSDDSIRQQHKLEELQIRLITLEKKTADYESLQAELEEKKDALKTFAQISEEFEVLKQKNSRTITEIQKLEDQLKDAKEMTETQSLENAKLMREKAVVENDLLKTQALFKKSQAKADQVEKLMEENTKIISTKNSLETKVTHLADSIHKQNNQIAQLTNEKNQLQTIIDELQVRLIKLEREKRKEYKTVSTQANAPKEPKVDKEKIRTLLKGLWACVETQQRDSENQLLLQDSGLYQILPPSPRILSYTSPSASHTTQETCSFPIQSDPTRINQPVQAVVSHQAHLLSPIAKKVKDSSKNGKRLSKQHKKKQPLLDLGDSQLFLEDVLTLFKPIPPCISPLQDLEPESVESMETDKDEIKTHLIPACTSVNPQKQECVVITSVSNCENSPATPTREKLDLQVVAEQTEEHNSSGNVSNDIELNEISGIAGMNDRHSTDGKETHLDHEMQTGEESAAVDIMSSSPSMSNKMVLGKMPLAKESHQTPKTPTEICEPENVSETMKDDQSEFIPTMDVSLPAENDDKTTTVVGGQSPKGNDKTEQMGDAMSATPNRPPSTITEMRGPEENEERFEMEKPHLDLGVKVASQDVLVLEAQEEKECLNKEADMQKVEPCLSSNSDRVKTALKNDAEQRIDNISVGPLQEKDAKDQESSEVVTFTSESPVDSELKSGGTEEESASQDTEALDCNTLKESMHSICSRLSPVCLFPTVTIQALEAQPSPEKNEFSEKTPPNKNTLQSEKSSKEYGSTEVATPKVSLSKGKDRKRKCRSNTVSPPMSLQTRAATRNKECRKGPNSTDGVEKQFGQVVREEEPDAMVEDSTAQKECLGQVHSEMGPPLPRLLTPLKTPPKVGKSIHPRQAIGKLSFPSPMEGTASPSTPTQTNVTPTGQQLSASALNSPLHPNGVPSSPLQFGSATPKHAVPVPGRLPSTAMNSSSSSSSPSQENSMRILDTMYPELSAHGRTLSILRGNVSLNICSSASGTLPVTSISQMSCFKTVNSTATAFTKTDKRGTKRHISTIPEPRNSKYVKVDDGSYTLNRKQMPPSSSNSSDGTASPLTPKFNQSTHGAATTSVDEGEHSEKKLIDEALKKIENQCFDLLPVIQSHLFVGNKPKKPVLRSEEIEVISEVCQNSLHEADGFICAIWSKLKTERRELSTNYIQALCRVYTGICRQKNDWDKARVLAYSILTEDFRDAAKLILFMVTTWPSLLSHQSSLCRAIHAVTKLKAEEKLLSCCSAFLGWEENPPCDVDELISESLSDLRSGSRLSFTKHSRYGDDLGTGAWECVLTLHLLCAHKKWKWTYENVLGNELWPLMNTWVAQPRDKQTPISDVTVATVLRLIGRLSQLGIRERLTSSVLTVANIINTFGRHASAEGVPWEVQLSAIYCIHDLSPSNPKQALDALAEWRGETSGNVPPAVTSCINQLASVCRQVRSR